MLTSEPLKRKCNALTLEYLQNLDIFSINPQIANTLKGDYLIAMHAHTNYVHFYIVWLT